MSFNFDSMRNSGSAVCSEIAESARAVGGKFQENPTEFLRTNGKTLLLAAAFFTSLISSPFLTVGAGFIGAVYSINVSNVENEFINFFTLRSPETKVVAAIITGAAYYGSGFYLFSLTIGAHIGMLLGSKNRQTESLSTFNTDNEESDSSSDEFDSSLNEWIERARPISDV